MHGKTWHVELFISEQDGTTTARAILHAESPQHLEGRGAARRNSGDTALDEIVEEVATARALHELAANLIATAATDIVDVREPEVHLPHPRPHVPVR